MKTIKKVFETGVVFLTLLIMTTACEKENTNTENEKYLSILKVADDGATSVIEPNLELVLTETPSISDEEMALLLEMKEEEKLAHDVYTFFYQKWGSQIFYNISQAEERHTNAVVLLLEYYGSDDVTVEDAGIFSIDEFKTLYNNLVTAGSVSVEEAFKTGTLIEEMDIKDLKDALEVVKNENIILVFENLLKGSRNHLRAFIRHLTSLGLSYAPVFISEDEYEQIINSPMEQGNQYRLNKQGKQGRHGKHWGNGENGRNGRQSGN
jgi:hypothetical protein